MTLYDNIKMAYDEKWITKDELFTKVKEGKISKAEYFSICGEECPEIDIQIIKDRIIKAMSDKCRDVIINEFYSNCLGESKLFGCSPDEEQQEITGLFFIAQSIVKEHPEYGDVALPDLEFKAKGENRCYSFTPNQIIKLGLDFKTHKTNAKNRYYDLKEWANNQIEANILEAWSWDIELN